MRLGVSLRSFYPAGDVRALAQQMVERARAVSDAGVDYLLVGDSHTTGPLPYFQNAPMLGRLLAEWSDGLAGILMALPLWNPVLAAEQIGTLASIAPGRFVLVGGLGNSRLYAPMGIDGSPIAARFESGLAIVRQLLAGERVDVDDEHFRVVGASIAPIPPEPVDVWIAASAPPAIDRAARVGDGWLGVNDLTREQARAQLAHYLERCDAHDRAPGVVAIRRDVYVGEDAADAARVAGPVVARRVASPHRHERAPEEASVWGTAEDVAEQLLWYQELGYTDVVVRELADGHDDAVRSFERLAAVCELLRNA